jgi:vacuolar-type H+-ATPase subunit I/STV1
MSGNSTPIPNISGGLGTAFTTSVQSTGLELDNECLRDKLRQLRDENARLVAANHTLLGDAESVRYELHRINGRLYTAEKQASSYQSVVSELNLLRETLERERKTAEQELKEWQQKAEKSSAAVLRSEQLVCEMEVELDELRKVKRQVECK